jgi:hypothetical protein
MSATEDLPAEQRESGYKVGPGCPPKEYQFKPGESGNPDGPPKHRTNLWVWLCNYMGMTANERAEIDRTKLTAVQETALKMVERAVEGRGCGFERLARYIVDREEGKAVEHIAFDDDDEREHMRQRTKKEEEEIRKLVNLRLKQVLG